MSQQDDQHGESMLENRHMGKAGYSQILEEEVDWDV